MAIIRLTFGFTSAYGIGCLVGAHSGPDWWKPAKMHVRRSIGSMLGLAIWATAAISAHLAKAEEPLVMADQGSHWTAAARAGFYGQDQGSPVMPLAWLKALRLPDGRPLLDDSLGRYGYLPNPQSSDGLPVGLVASGPPGSEVAGMTCAACHTRQIEAGGKTYRIDGGPAITDIGRFFADLDAAVAAVLSSDDAFVAFAAAVAAKSAPRPVEQAGLRNVLQLWYKRYHVWMGGLPERPWGPGRLDAVGMIFNRITGLDLGPAPDFLIPENVKEARAAVRYPFLWNAPKQDKTQWSGFLNNGSDDLALPRNLGQVYGTFGDFHPGQETRPWNVLHIDYLKHNSANFDALERIESLVKLIGPPKWPWSIDRELAARGKEVFEWPQEKGGCAGCHGRRPGQVQFPNNPTWATEVQDVGTDTAQYGVLTWTVKTGVLEGAEIPLLREPLKPYDCAISVLATSVLGAIIEKNVLMPLAFEGPYNLGDLVARYQQHPSLEGMRGAFRVGDDLRNLGCAAGTGRAAKYEARVLEGIWAAAPYLHNGSVPTLTELLKPAALRAARFKVGPAYDTVNVGLAAEQTKFGFVLETTDCSARDSGNSRCGHEYGTQLKPEEKKALIEYLKTL